MAARQRHIRVPVASSRAVLESAQEGYVVSRAVPLDRAGRPRPAPSLVDRGFLDGLDNLLDNLRMQSRAAMEIR